MSTQKLKVKRLTRAMLSLIMVLTIFVTACGDTSTPVASTPANSVVTSTIGSTATGTNAITTAPATTTNQATTATSTTALATSTIAITTANPTTPIAVSNSPATTTSSATSADGFDPDESEVYFNSGPDQIYGTLLIPNDSKTGKKPAALILGASGQTDRNDGMTVNTYHNFARVLADQGVVSLRYDKLTSGKTGMASYASHAQDIDFNVYIEEARAAYDYLKSRPEVDPTRLMILGHGEGGLIALAVSERLKSSGGPKALVLATPTSRPILELFRAELMADYAARVKNGTYSQADVDEILAEFDSVGKSLVETGKLPAIKNLVLYQYFSKDEEKFIAQKAKYDPAKIAAELPPTMPVLLFCGEKDSDTSCKNVSLVSQGFESSGNKNVSFSQIPNMDHFFKDLASGPSHGDVDLDKIDPRIKFSTEANNKLADFVKTKL